MLDQSEFGGVLNGSVFLNDFAGETRKKNITNEQKIHEAFSYVQKAT